MGDFSVTNAITFSGCSSVVGSAFCEYVLSFVGGPWPSELLLDRSLSPCLGNGTAFRPLRVTALINVSWFGFTRLKLLSFREMNSLALVPFP